MSVGTLPFWNKFPFPDKAELKRDLIEERPRLLFAPNEKADDLGPDFWPWILLRDPPYGRGNVSWPWRPDARLLQSLGH